MNNTSYIYSLSFSLRCRKSKIKMHEKKGIYAIKRIGDLRTKITRQSISMLKNIITIKGSKLISLFFNMELPTNISFVNKLLYGIYLI